MQHILLIGFKHAGKTSIGQMLAERMEKPFIDLDQKIEDEHEKRNGGRMSVRQIVLNHGLDFFRTLESQVLDLVLREDEQQIVALGGGTPIDERNRAMIAVHRVVHVTADKSNIYERIMVNGRPAFFKEDEDPYLAFRRVWDERSQIYDSIAQITISNNDSLDRPVGELVKILNI